MKEFEDINYSIWCDFIERDFLENRFQEIINDEVIKGATSNPAIFPASFVACLCESLKYAGTVITALSTVCPK